MLIVFQCNIYLILGPLCKPLLVMEPPNKRLLLLLLFSWASSRKRPSIPYTSSGRLREPFSQVASSSYVPVGVRLRELRLCYIQPSHRARARVALIVLATLFSMAWYKSSCVYQENSSNSWDIQRYKLEGVT